jgi:hypothetical protein
MKKQLLIISTCILTALCFLQSCQKGNGLAGENGKDGTIIISGFGIPNFGIGKAGDFFVDTIGKVMWGPKNTVSWGTGLALVGPTGLPGKSLLSGTGAPVVNMGVNGDFYMDIVAKAIYGPKTAAGWGVATNMIGPSGANGATGATGATGAAGTPAQVIYSPWITSPYNSRDTTIDGTCVRVRHLNAPSLSALILDRGIMITYMRVGSIGPYALPYTSDAGGATNMVNCIYNQQKILVYRHTFNTCRFNSGIAATFPGQPVLVNLPQSLEYRYVLIPGLISGGRMANGSLQQNLHNVLLPGQTTTVDITTMPYDEICKMLGLPK